MVMIGPALRPPFWVRRDSPHATWIPSSHALSSLCWQRITAQSAVRLLKVSATHLPSHGFAFKYRMILRRTSGLRCL